MQSFTFIVVLGLIAASTAQDPVKACLKTTDECAAGLETTKGIFRNLRAIGTNDPKQDIPKYIKELHDFFEVNLNQDCKIETCKCIDGKLECDNTRENIKNLIEKVDLPTCITENPVASRLLQRFSKSVKESNREQTLSVLNLLEKVTVTAVAKADNDKQIACISETVQKIRAPIKERLQTFDFQPNCDFCVAA